MFCNQIIQQLVFLNPSVHSSPPTPTHTTITLLTVHRAGRSSVMGKVYELVVQLFSVHSQTLFEGHQSLCLLRDLSA